MRSVHRSASILIMGAQNLAVDPIKVHAETFSMLGVIYGPLIVRKLTASQTSSAECAAERDCMRMFPDQGQRRTAVV
jgi:hypothetical protein